MAKRRGKQDAGQTGIGPLDAHLVMSARSRVMKLFGPDGRQRWQCLARAEGVSGPGWTQTGGDTPPGRYSCSPPILTRQGEPDYARLLEVYGPAFVPLVDEEERARGGATGIGIHGGRDRSPGYRPARATELAPTRGCIRVDNEDLMARVVPAVQYILGQGGKLWLSVIWE